MIGHQLSSIKQIALWLWNTWKGYRLQASLNAIIGLVLVLSELAFVWATKLSIDVATHVNHDFSLQGAIALLVGILLLQQALGISAKWIRATLGVKAQNRMQQSVFGRLLQSQLKALRKFHTGNLLNRIERDVTDVISLLTEHIPALLNTLVQFVGAFLFLFWMDRTLACIVITIVPFFILCSKLYIKKMRRLTHEVRDTESHIQSIIQESLQHTLILKTLERTGTALDKLFSTQERLRKEVITKTRYSTVSFGLMNLGFATGYMVTFAWGVTNLEKGLITYGALVAFIQLVGQIQAPVRSLTKFVPVFIGAFTASERLMELEQIPLEPADDNRHLPTPAGIRVNALSFSYDTESRKIFKDFSFDFPPQSITAILGETGSGKTTLIRLMLALAEPTAGNICLYAASGENVIASPATRCNFSYVPQGNTLLSGTIRDNLRLGNPKASAEDMEKALADAGADFVFRLPKGLDTICGEMGDGLSEGQAQRISIARALLRDCSILLLDEATSALDEATERTVIQNIIKAYRHRTLIFITHRPEVLKHCTQTLELNKKNFF